MTKKTKTRNPKLKQPERIEPLKFKFESDEFDSAPMKDGSRITGYWVGFIMAPIELGALKAEISRIERYPYDDEMLLTITWEKNFETDPVLFTRQASMSFREAKHEIDAKSEEWRRLLALMLGGK